MRTAKENATMETETKVRRKRRTKEEIERDRLEAERLKAEKAAARAAKKAAKGVKATKAAKETSEEDSSEDKKKVVKKGNGQKAIAPPKGQWSDPTSSTKLEIMTVEVEILEPMLGTQPSNSELLDRYIISKAPDAISKEEEIAAIGEEQVVQNGTTIFMQGWFGLSENNCHFIDKLDRTEGGGVIDKDVDLKLPFVWNYQLRGFFKDSCGLLARGSYGESANLRSYKKVIDGGIFVYPRRLAIDLPEQAYDEFGNEYEVIPDKLPVLQRPLRIQDRNGERTAIASSELVPAGARIKFKIGYTDPKFHDVIVEWLNYGAVHGLGAWRNSGRGAFRWRELNEDWSPIEE